MTTPLASHGVTIAIGNTTPAALVSLGSLSMSAEEIDTTCHGTSNVKTKIGGLVDLGTIDVTIQYDKTEISGFYALIGGSSETVVVTFPYTTSETLTFSAFVSGITIDAANGDVVKATIKLTLDGGTAPTWA